MCQKGEGVRGRRKEEKENITHTKGVTLQPQPLSQP